MKRKRILILNEPEPVGGPTWWRMYRPLLALQRDYEEALEIVWNRGTLLPVDFLNVDLAIAFRPSEPAQIGVIQHCKAYGIPVISDWDDDLINIPVYHTMYESLGTKTEYVRAGLALSDAVWCSTVPLAAVLQHPNAKVIANAVEVADVAGSPSPAQNKVAMWRGHWMHYSDLWHREQQYQDILKRCKQFQWFGMLPPYQHDREKVKFHPIQDAVTYFQATRALGVNVVWKPLMETEFNAAKSNIAWIEATCIGAVCFTNFAGKIGWKYATPKLSFDPDVMQGIWEESRDQILRHYMLQDANVQRLQSIMSFF